jgi:hypothetical protein
MSEPSEIDAAIIAWIGWGKALSPMRDDARVIALFGEADALRLLPIVRSLAADFERTDAPRVEPDLIAIGERASREFRDRHPDVSADAVQALEWAYTFDQR